MCICYFLLSYKVYKKYFTQEYTPTHQDILHCRKATKGISEFVIPINNIPFLFVDVGGQRSQRQKWYQCFDCVTSILFLVSSSEFDQVLLEDRYVISLFILQNHKQINNDNSFINSYTGGLTDWKNLKIYLIQS